MATIGGPKGTPGQRSPALARFLEAERAKRVAREQAQGASSTPTEAPAMDRFADVPGLSGPNRQVTGTFTAPFAQLPTTGPSAGQGALSVRLGAMTGGDVTGGAERAGLRVLQGPGGKVAEGDLSARRASDLDVLQGVVLLRGSLDLSETLLEGGDLSALRQLARVDGGLALEGNAALSSLDALARLSHVGGNLYLGFNDALARVELPALQRVGGALIVEGNRALTELSLPALTHVSAYLHLHENDVLSRVVLERLSELAGELSLEDNPRLHEVGLPALRVTPPSIS